MWRKHSSDTKVTDISLSINGFIIFSFLNDIRDTYIIFMNHGIYERFTN